MKHSIAAIAGTGIFAALAAIPSAGQAAAASQATQGNMYLGVSGDLTWLRHSDMGGGGNVALGYRFDDFRIEAEAGYHGASGRDSFGSTHYFSYMGNVYYDFKDIFSSSKSDGQIAPYIGVGLGDAAVHFGSSSIANTFHHHENDFAYQGMAGFVYTPVSMSNTDWTLGYRYTGTDSNNIHASSLELGVRFHF